jgi:hypothetical protein
MGNHKVKIKLINDKTLDVLKIISDKPSEFESELGEATEIGGNEDVSLLDERLFTTTRLPETVLEENIENFKEQFYTCGWHLR